MIETAQVVCCNCKNGLAQLFRLKDADNKKTNDYICVNCKPNFSLNSLIPGSSHIPFTPDIPVDIMAALSQVDKQHLSSMLLGKK